jgi:hypothetical protein
MGAGLRRPCRAMTAAAMELLDIPKRLEALERLEAATVS